MEPILVILLLFGAFTLGAETADSQTVETVAPVSAQQSKEAEGKAVVLSLKNCLSGPRPILYRDLTVPFTRQQMTVVEAECADE